MPAGTRPVSDQAREGLFSSLGGLVRDASVLDLFAGTGAMGIEALSRGAALARFVDSAPAAVRTIAENLRRTKLQGRATVLRRDVLRTVAHETGPYDLIILDPPYRVEGQVFDSVLATIDGRGIVAPQARVVLTRSSRSYTPVIPVDWQVERRLSYGDTVLLVFLTP